MAWLKRTLSLNPTLFSAGQMQLPSQEDVQPLEPLTPDPPANASSSLLLQMASVCLPHTLVCITTSDLIPELSNGQHKALVAREGLAALSSSTMSGPPTTHLAGVEPPASLNGS